MSIATVVTRGFGSFGTIPLVTTMGYNIGIPPSVIRPTDVDGLKAMSIFTRSVVSATNTICINSKAINIKAGSVS